MKRPSFNERQRWILLAIVVIIASVLVLSFTPGVVDFGIRIYMMLDTGIIIVWILVSIVLLRLSLCLLKSKLRGWRWLGDMNSSHIELYLTWSWFKSNFRRYYP